MDTQAYRTGTRRGLSIIGGFFLMFCVSGIVPAQANVRQMGNYKQAFPDSKIKCISCHVEAMPRPGKGLHGWNDYGKAVIAEAKKVAEDAEVTADAFKAVGKVEDFKGKTK